MASSKRFMVDGMIEGVWKAHATKTEATLAVRAWRPLTAREREEATEE